MPEETLRDDGSCPKCGSADVKSMLFNPPMQCQACGWRGYTGPLEGHDENEG